MLITAKPSLSSLKLLLVVRLFYFICINVLSARMAVCTALCVCRTGSIQKRSLYPLGLELHKVVIHQLGASS